MPIPLILFIILLGFLPSCVWLFIYLKKDCHPEPRRLLVETFFFAILLAPLAIAAQWLFAHLLVTVIPGFDVGDSSVFYLWAAFAEEIIKFLVVYYLIIHRPEFDEPIDAMIYLITAALGFAAIENVLVLFKNAPDGLTITFQLILLRFIGATLLHALSSSLLGYFLGLSWFFQHHSRKFLWFGIASATLFHFSFNMILLKLNSFSAILTSSALLLLMMFFVSILFTKMRERSASRLSTREPWPYEGV